MFYKDLGYFYIEQGLDKNEFGVKVSHNFYEVAIDHISFISNGTFSTMLNARKGDEIYALSFDFSSQILDEILSLISINDKIKIRQMIDNGKASSVDLQSPIIIKNIQAKVGNLERNANEIYAPFIIEKIEI